MASFTILSEKWGTEEQVLSNLFIAFLRAKLDRFSFHKSDGKLQIFNQYGSREEIFRCDTFSEENYNAYLKEYAHLEPDECNPHITILPDGRRFFRLATSDDSSDERVAYSLIKEYLKLNIEDFIYEDWSESIISVADIKEIESKGGYHRDWYFKGNSHT